MHTIIHLTATAVATGPQDLGTDHVHWTIGNRLDNGAQVPPGIRACNSISSAAACGRHAQAALQPMSRQICYELVMNLVSSASLWYYLVGPQLQAATKSRVWLVCLCFHHRVCAVQHSVSNYQQLAPELVELTSRAVWLSTHVPAASCGTGCWP